MHLLDFIFGRRSVAFHPHGSLQTSRGEADASTCSPSSPLAASTVLQSSNLPPYIQLYQPRESAVVHTLGPRTSLSGQAGAELLVQFEAPSSSIHPELRTAAKGEPLVCKPDNVIATVASDISSNTEPAADPEAILKGPSLSLKDCHSRACAGVVDSFRKAMWPGGKPEQGHTVVPSNPSLHHSGESDIAVMRGPQAEVAATTLIDLSTGSTATGGDTSGTAESGGGAGGDRSNCPPDTWQLGRATWTFLHSMAAHYPEHPSPRQQELMRGIMEGLAEFYPCEVCAEHLREQMKRTSPQVATARDLNLWLCGIHNEVNEMLGKPLFNCNRLLERWRDGPPDGSCD
ncbi:hypothetical protein VaNZ11_011944 [Volvox africanus]|uniref:Sulfhydryl oxidase n=1 Tax=Volvox africanus TaxID=51714 RepID=A0ABQ5SCN8_9CHLO|nr:hypothetical protein VaNZ11_011944 [Volvox africanus]